MRPRGFTIIELLVVISIIGLLMAAASLAFSDARKTGRDTQRMSDILSIAKAVDQTQSSTGLYPRYYIDTKPYNEVGVDILPDMQPPVSTSNFADDTVPQDPLPLLTDAVDPGLKYSLEWHRNPAWGYIYQDNSVDSTYPDYPSEAGALQVQYVLEINLENPLPSDDTTFKTYTENQLNTRQPDMAFGSSTYPYPINSNEGSASGATNSGRYLYYLPGPYCGANCPTQ